MTHKLQPEVIVERRPRRIRRWHHIKVRVVNIVKRYSVGCVIYAYGIIGSPGLYGNIRTAFPEGFPKTENRFFGFIKTGYVKILAVEYFTLHTPWVGAEAKSV